MMELAKDKRVILDPAPEFLVVDYADSAILVRLRLYAKYTDVFQLRYDLNRRLKSVFEKHNIDIPYPQRVVRYLESNKKISAANER